MADLKNVTDATFEELVLRAKTPVLVDFTAEWCGPCKALAPALQDLAREYEGEAEILKLDIDANKEMTDKYGVRGIPYLLLFKDGEILETVTGSHTRSHIAAAIDRALGEA